MDKDEVTNAGRADFTELVIPWFLKAQRKKEWLRGVLGRSDSEFDGGRGWQPPRVCESTSVFSWGGASSPVGQEDPRAERWAGA